MQPQPGHVTRAHLLVNPLRNVFLIYYHGGIYRIISMVDYAIYTQPKISSNVSVSIPHMSVISLISVLKQ